MEESPFRKRPQQQEERPQIDMVVRRGSLLRRCGCLLGIILWMLLLIILPCGFVTLLVEKEIRFSLSDLPDDELRIFLLNSDETRGIGFQRPDIYSGGADEDAYCIITSTHYFVWEGDAQNVKTCNCYQKIEDEWVSVLVGGDENCNPSSE